MFQLMLILALAWAVQISACPVMCVCKQRPMNSYIAATCYGISENFTDFQINELTLFNSTEIDFENFLQDTLGYVTNLTRLSFKQSVLPDLKNLSSLHLEALEYLDLSYNNIEHLWDDSFNVTNLQTLDLSNNLIRIVFNDSLRTFPNLEVLNVSANNVTVITPGSFVGLFNLRCLDLSENNITILNDEVFIPLTSLQYLNLSSNRLEVLSEICFSGLHKLQQLDISWNRLARVAPGSLELPSLARLLLAGNPNLGGSRESTVFVGTGHRLQTVDASRTGLKQVPAALTHSIRTLRLAGNSIRTLRCGDLDSYPLLQLLDFTSNRLGFTEDDALGRLESLTVLYLTDNKIREIPKSLPEKLKVLHLEQNTVEKVTAGDLRGLTELEVLLLGDNKIRIVEQDAFVQLIALVILDMSKNPISILQTGCLSGPTALQVLRLTSIEITPPAKEVSFPLSSTEHLIILDLSRSPGLARQFLADTAALAASRELQELNLSFTDLQYLRSDLLHYIPQLRSLHLVGNKLNCTYLQWLASWLRRQDTQEYRHILCASPPEMWGTLLVDLQETDVGSISTTESMVVTTERIATVKTQLGSPENKFGSSIRNNINNVEPEFHLQNTSDSDPNITYFDQRKHSEFSNKTQTFTFKSNRVIFNFNTSITIPATPNNKLAYVANSLNESYRANATSDEIHEFELDKIGNTPTAEPEIATDLSTSSEGKSSNNKDESTVKYNNNNLEEIYLEEAATTYNIDAISNSQHRWNDSAGEISMFVTDGQTHNTILHPSLIILSVGLLITIAVVTIFTVRCHKKNKMSRSEQDDIEVSLPSVTELW